MSGKTCSCRVRNGKTPRKAAPSRMEESYVLRGCPATSVRQPVHDVVHAQLVGFVRVVDRTQAGTGPLPELRDVGVVVDDHLEPLCRIVVFVDAAEDGATGVVRLR